MRDGTSSGRKKLPITLGWVALVLLSGIGTHFVANYDRYLPYRWQTYTSPDGSFSVQLPGAPTIAPSKIPLTGGTTSVHFVTASPTAHTVFQCGYVEQESIVGKSPDDVLVAARDGSMKGIHGTLLKQTRLEVHGHPALDAQVSAHGTELFDSRTIIAGNRVNMIIAFADTEQEREPKTVQRVMDSFKILRK